MVEARNESIGGFPFGGYHDGFGGGGILGLIALLSIFRGNLFGGNYHGARENLCELSEQFGNIRADIGQSKYDTVNSIMQQTSTLLSSLAEGRIENLSAILSQTNQLQSALSDVDRDVLKGQYKLKAAIDNNGFENYKGQMSIMQQMAANAAEQAECCCETNLNITRMGYENQIGNLKQTSQLLTANAALANKISDCCCETNQNIERTAFATQLRDLENKCSTDAKLKELECGQKAILDKITESRLLEENCRLKDKVDALREKDERGYMAALAGRTNCLVTETANAAKAYFAATTPTTPYPWNIPVCGCSGY